MPNQIQLQLYAQDLLLLEQMLMTVPVFIPSTILIVIPIAIAVPIVGWATEKIINWWNQPSSNLQLLTLSEWCKQASILE